MNRTRPNKQKGTVAVELAIVLPLFALLLVGTIEFGSIARDHQVLKNAARDGARFSAQSDWATVSTDPNVVKQMIQNRVISYLANERITVAAADITVDRAYPVPIGALTVNGTKITVRYARPLIIPGAASFIPQLASFQLTGDAVFRNFY